MTSTNLISLMQTLTATNMLGLLISLDDAPVMLHLLSVLRGLMVTPSVNGIEAKAAAAAITKNIVLMSNDDDEDENDYFHVIRKSVLVTAAKHGGSNIVQAVTNKNRSNNLPEISAETIIREEQSIDRHTQEQTVNQEILNQKHTRDQEQITNQEQSMTREQTRNQQQPIIEPLTDSVASDVTGKPQEQPASDTRTRRSIVGSSVDAITDDENVHIPIPNPIRAMNDEQTNSPATITERAPVSADGIGSGDVAGRTDEQQPVNEGQQPASDTSEVEVKHSSADIVAAVVTADQSTNNAAISVRKLSTEQIDNQADILEHVAECVADIGDVSGEMQEQQQEQQPASNTRTEISPKLDNDDTIAVVVTASRSNNPDAINVRELNAEQVNEPLAEDVVDRGMEIGETEEQQPTSDTRSDAHPKARATIPGVMSEAHAKRLLTNISVPGLLQPNDQTGILKCATDESVAGVDNESEKTKQKQGASETGLGAKVHKQTDMTPQFPSHTGGSMLSDEPENSATASASRIREAAIQQFEKFMSNAREQKDQETIGLLLLVDPRPQPNNQPSRQAKGKNRKRLARQASATQGTIALWYACFSGDIDKVKLLLTANDVSPAANDNAAVRLACLAGHMDMVKYLMSDTRVDPAAKDHYVILTASYNNYVEIIKLLLFDGRVDPAARNNAAIGLASCTGNIDAVRLLLSDKRVDETANDDYPIRNASVKGHTDVVQLLLARPQVNPGADDNYAVRFASCKGHTDTVKLLLADHRVDPRATDNYAMRLASYKGHAEVLKLLLADLRVDPAAAEDTPIGMACQNGHTEAASLLLADSRVDPAADDDYAVYTASENGHTDTVKLLLADTRVNPAARNNLGFRLACKHGHIDTAKLLLSDSRVNPAAEDDFAIYSASENGHTETVKLLLTDTRVNPAARDNLGFRLACKHGHTETANLLLLDPRVNPAAEDDQAIRLASCNGHAETVKLLLKDPRVNPSAKAIFTA